MPAQQRAEAIGGGLAGGDHVVGVERHRADAGGQVGGERDGRAPPCRRGGRRWPRARSTCRRGRRPSSRPCGSRPASRSAGRADPRYTPSGRSGRRCGPARAGGGVEVGQVDEARRERRRRVGPVSGDRPVRLMWSLISTGWPTAHSRRSEPAPLVSTTVRHPAAAATRTAWATTAPARDPRRGGRGRGRRARGDSPTAIERTAATVARRPTAAGSPGRSAKATRRRPCRWRRRPATSPSRARRRRRGASTPVRSASAAPRPSAASGDHGVGASRRGSYDPGDAHDRVARRPRRPDRPDPAAPRGRVAGGRATSTR